MGTQKSVPVERATVNNVKVITVPLIAEKHGQPVRLINDTFKRNRDRFQEGVDYFFISRKEIQDRLDRFRDLKPLLTSNAQKGVYLFTEYGYLKLVKPMRDPEAWKVYEYVLQVYFDKTVAQSRRQVTEVRDWAQRLGVDPDEAKAVKAITKRFDQLVAKHNLGQNAKVHRMFYKSLFGEDQGSVIRKNPPDAKTTKRNYQLMNYPQILTVAGSEQKAASVLTNIGPVYDEPQDKLDAVLDVAGMDHALLENDSDTFLEKSFSLAEKMSHAKQVAENPQFRGSDLFPELKQGA